MKIEHHTSGPVSVQIDLVQKSDYKKINEQKHFTNFDWEKEIENEVFKLIIREQELVVGLVSVSDKDGWLKINLLESSKENVGRNKVYQGIAGCLIAHVCKLAFDRGYNGSVGLIPKTYLVKHYMVEYGFQTGGIHLFTEGDNSKYLINRFLI